MFAWSFGLNIFMNYQANWETADIFMLNFIRLTYKHITRLCFPKKYSKTDKWFSNYVLCLCLLSQQCSFQGLGNWVIL